MNRTTAVTMTVPARFRGPARSGNGGWSAGRLAEELMAHTGPTTVTVVLRQPPPLDIPIDVEVDGETATARHQGEVVATATRADADLAVVDGVTPDLARAAEELYAGLDFHPFPGCFACGTDREPGDGLRIFPGQVDDEDGRTRVAATWTPDASVGDPDGDPEGDEATIPATWAALDCIGGWAGDLTERLMVLGTMTAVVGLPPRIGEEHVVMGSARGREGRRTFTSAALYDSSGRAIAVAEHVWISVPRGDIG